MSVPPNLLIPAEVAPARVPAAVGDLAALVAEPPDGATTAGGVPVLLAPGYTGSKEDFLPILAPLARAGHRAAAIDLRGQHESTGPDGPEAYTLDALAKDVAAVLAWLGEPAHLVGHSFGGLVTRRSVIDGARPRTLTLLGSGPAALGGKRAQIIAMMRDLLQGGGGVEAIADAEEAMRGAALPTDVSAFLRQRWLNTSPTGLLVMGAELLAATDEVEALAAAGVPTLVVHGETDDAWLPAEQHAMAQRLRADYAVVPGAVHSPACEAPEPLVDILLRFWARW
ncbi:MAG TPA: alpha/beta fold hydrolase [Mycobacteriales bacterium]|nr:alpha/beta fold hydrolase [Mycobacteriales bacterium]